MPLFAKNGVLGDCTIPKNSIFTKPAISLQYWPKFLKTICYMSWRAPWKKWYLQKCDFLSKRTDTHTQMLWSYSIGISYLYLSCHLQELSPFSFNFQSSNWRFCTNLEFRMVKMSLLFIQFVSWMHFFYQTCTIEMAIIDREENGQNQPLLHSDENDNR